MSNNNEEENLDVPQSAGILDGVGIGEEKSELDKIFEKMLAPENIEHFTELNPGEITAFSTYGAYVNQISQKYKYELKMPKEWLIKNLTMRTSKGRKGKLEMVKITARNPWQENQQGNNTSIWNRFRGP